MVPGDGRGGDGEEEIDQEACKEGEGTKGEGIEPLPRKRGRRRKRRSDLSIL